MTLVIYTRRALDKLGLVVNPNMWITSWMYCAVCRENQHHYAMSHRNASDCFEVCRNCQSYSGKYNPYEIH